MAVVRRFSFGGEEQARLRNDRVPQVFGNPGYQNKKKSGRGVRALNLGLG